MSCNIDNNRAQTQPPFIIKCLSEQCTIIYAGDRQFTASAIDDEINIGSEFGRKLKQARDEVSQL